MKGSVTEKDRDFHLLLQSPNGHNGGARQVEAEGQVSHMGEAAQISGPSAAAFPGASAEQQSQVMGASPALPLLLAMTFIHLTPMALRQHIRPHGNLLHA